MISLAGTYDQQSPLDAPADSVLVRRLAALRRAVRRRLLALGLCVVLAGGICGFLSLVILDWLLWLPGLVRAVLLITFLVIIGRASWRLIVRPLRAPLALEELAGQVERYFGHLSDQLSSAVNFLRRGPGSMPALARQVVADADDVMAALPADRVLAMRPLRRRVALLAICTIVLAAIAWVRPGWISLGLYRYAVPFSAVQWPRKVEIVAEFSPRMVALGEPLMVRMRIARGLSDDLRPMVGVRSANGDITRLAMARDDAGEFVAVIDSVYSDVAYWFEAGDDDTEDRPVPVRVVRRPRIVQAVATVHPPAYAFGAPPVRVDLDTGPAIGVSGSLVGLDFRSSKPLAADANGVPAASLVIPGADAVPLIADTDDPLWWHAETTLDGDTSFRVHVVGEHGFSNAGGATYFLSARADQPPQVAITSPAGVAEVLPGGSLELQVRTEDDLGLDRLALRASKSAADEPFVRVDLTTELELERGAERVVGKVAYVWDLAPLGLSAGDTVWCHAEATDNFRASDIVGQVARSAPLRIKIIGNETFQERLRDEFNLLAGRLREVLFDQDARRDDAEVLQRELDQGPQVTATSAADAWKVGREQGRLVVRLRELSRRFAEIHRRMERNRYGDADQRGALQRMAQELGAIATGPSAEAAALLNTLRPGTATAAGRSQLQSAVDRQSAAARRLRDAVGRLSQWGDFRQVLARVRDLLDRQQAVRRRTRELGKETMGQAVDSLPAARQVVMRRLQRSQTQLADDASRLVERLRGLVDRRRDEHSETAEALENALRAGIAAQIPARMTAAAEALGANRTAAAALDQRAAEVGLARMLAGMQKRRIRELARLAKRVEDAEQTVGRLLERQRELLEINVEAQHARADHDAVVRLGQQQQTLRRNAGHVAGDVAEIQQAERAARFVERAVDAMREAEVPLLRGHAVDATEHQRHAVDHLERALAELRRLAEHLARERQRRSLAMTRVELEEIRGLQEEINATVDEVRQKRDSVGRLQRAGARKLDRSARTETELADRVAVLADNLQGARVFEWLLSNVNDAMRAAVAAFEDRRLDDELEARLASIVRDLSFLVSALVETERMPPPDEFAEGGGGGGGGGGMGGDGKAVPTVAELLALKQMQQDLHARTVAVSEGFDASTATEVQLRRVQGLGEEQGRLQRLFEEVTREGHR